MIVRVQMVNLEQVVIDILRAELGADALEPDRLQRQHYQRTGCILRQGLIDADRNRLAGAHLAINEMRRNQFLGNILWHPDSLLDCDAPACFDPQARRLMSGQCAPAHSVPFGPR